MVICSLGEEWKDPATIPAAEIIDIWCDQSKKGRYEGQLWKDEMLTHMLSAKEDEGTGNRDGVNEDGEVDAVEDGGFFARWGREPARRGRDS
eukprot:2030800-Prymnesium_polylepis.1